MDNSQYNENAEIFLVLNYRLKRNSRSKKSIKLMSPEFSGVAPRTKKPEDSGYAIAFGE